MLQAGNSCAPIMPHSWFRIMIGAFCLQMTLPNVAGAALRLQLANLSASEAAINPLGQPLLVLRTT